MRFGVLALTGLLALPATAAAQIDGGFAAEPPAELVPYTRFAITPWVGFRVPYGVGEYFVFTEVAGEQISVDEDRGGGAAVGLDAAYRIHGPLNVVAGVAYSARDEDRLSLLREDGTEEAYEANGPEVWFIKAGLQYRLPDPIPDYRRFHPAAYVTVAPAIVIADHPDIAGLDSDEVNGTSTHFALNLGVDASTNLGSRGLTLTFALEDYITFWDQDRMRTRDEVLFSGLLEDNVFLEYNTLASSVLMMRAGVSWRF
jgi:hypothetical protein